MKLSAAFLIISACFFSANAHLLIGEWTPVDAECQRPTSGACSQAGTCCSQRGSGTQRWSRTCVEGHCDNVKLAETRACTIKCRIADANAYGAFTNQGICQRPTTGVCAKAGACCGQRVGTQTQTRACNAANGCAAGTTTKTVVCPVRCDQADAGAYGPFENQGICQRPTTGECAKAGACCGQRVGTQSQTRACNAGNGCAASVLTRTVVCPVRCDQADAGAYGPFENQGICERPASGSCSLAGSCCGDRVGTQTQTRACNAGNGCAAGVLSRTLVCPITCNQADAGAYGPYVNQGTCQRPTTGECAKAGACCGQRVGTQTQTRACNAANGCAPGTTSRTLVCPVRCDVADAGAYGPFENQGICQRPTTGVCAKAGACCGQRVGTQAQTRACNAGNGCNASVLSRTLVCPVRCDEADAGAYGPYENQGICQRPTSGSCSLAGSCCGQRVGTQSQTRACNAGNGCAAGVLSRTLVCPVTCDQADAGAFGPYENQGICQRPTTGECAKAGACCGQRVGTQSQTRACNAANGCATGSLTRTLVCPVSCEESDAGAFGPYQVAGACERPAAGNCALAGNCCGDIAGTQKHTRSCNAGNGCTEGSLVRYFNCNINCATADAGAFGEYVQASDCIRPATGACSGEDTCCGQNEGSMKYTRACLAGNGCSPGSLVRHFNCNLRCGFVPPCQRFPNPCLNGATCNPDGDSHTCTCAAGWTGHHCETPSGGVPNN